MTDKAIDLSSLPWSDIETVLGVAPGIITALKGGQTPEQIVAELEPSTIKVVEFVANIFLPGSGDLIAVLNTVVTLIVTNSHAMTSAEQALWFARVQGDH